MTAQPGLARLSRMTVSNYRSVGEDVWIDFEPLTVLVGINGSGKSNLLDAPRFVAQALTEGLESAVEDRHGFDALLRDVDRPRGTVRIGLEIGHDDWSAVYSVEIGRGKRRDEFAVRSERLDLVDRTTGRRDTLAKSRYGKVTTTLSGLDRPVKDTRNLALLAVGGDERLVPVVDALKAVETYALFPEELREVHPPDSRRYLSKFGANWPSIVRRVMASPSARDLRLALDAVTGHIVDIRASRPIAGRNAVEFAHWRGDGRVQWFPASRESDGTLRVAGILTALVQQPPLLMVGIEEPEQTVHVGVLQLLYEFLEEAARSSTVVVTTHSADLLDLVPVEAIRVVTRIGGTTRVSRLDESQQDLVRQQLESPGGLLRSQGLLAQEQ